MRRFLITSSLIVVLLFPACNPTDSSSDVTVPEYDSYEYCYNGFAIIGMNGEYGMADTSGNIILPAKYDEIGFVSDKLAIVGEGGIWSLVTTSGQVLAESDDKEFLVSGSDRIVRKAEADNILLWDSVLNRFGNLCELAIAGEPDDMKKMLETLGEIKELSEQSRGKMTPQQAAQFEEIINRYNQVKGK